MRRPAEPLAHVPEALSRSLCGEGAAAFLERLTGPPGLAAFDADGTLWDDDIGEAVLIELFKQRLLIDPPADPRSEYERLLRRDPAAGVAYAAALMRGLTETFVAGFSARLFRERFALYAEQRFLLETLLVRGWDVYVVSASNRWSIEASVATLGLAPLGVIALELEVDGGTLTDRAVLPIPTLEGKPSLLHARAGRAPDLAFGNSVLDLPLLAAATHPVAVGRLRAEGRSQNQFLAQAERRGWARLEIPAAP